MPPGVNNNNIVSRKVGINPASNHVRHPSCMDCHYFGKDPVLLAQKQLALSSEMNDVYIIDFTKGVMDSVKEMGIGIKDLLKFAYAVEVKTKELKMLLLKATISKGARKRLKEICVGIAATSRNSIEIIDDLMESVNSESVKEALGKYKNKLLNGDNEHSKAYYQGHFAVELILWAPVIYGLVLKGARIAGKAAKGLAELGGRMKGLVKLPEYVREGKLAGTEIRLEIRDFVKNLIRDERGSVPISPKKAIPDEAGEAMKKLEDYFNALINKGWEDDAEYIIKLYEKVNGDVEIAQINKIVNILTNRNNGKFTERTKYLIRELKNGNGAWGALLEHAKNFEEFGRIQKYVRGITDPVSRGKAEKLLKNILELMNHEDKVEMNNWLKGIFKRLKPYELESKLIGIESESKVALDLLKNHGNKFSKMEMSMIIGDKLKGTKTEIDIMLYDFNGEVTHLIEVKTSGEKFADLAEQLVRQGRAIVEAEKAKRFKLSKNAEFIRVYVRGNNRSFGTETKYIKYEKIFELVKKEEELRYSLPSYEKATRELHGTNVMHMRVVFVNGWGI